MSLAISGLVLTQNSENTIKRCLDSLKELDEVVVVDGGSHDKTEDICRSYPNVSFYSNPWPGFIAQREFSRLKARNSWCLMMDSDEKITKEALKECAKVIEQADPYPMYEIVRTEYFNSVPIESGHGKSDYQERLFLKNRVQYYGGNHHLHKIDGLPVEKNRHLIGKLPHHLRILHDPHYGMYEWIQKLPRFALLIAEEKYQKRKISLLEVTMAFPLNFLKIYLKSYRQGREGLIISLQTALVRTLIKLRIYELQNYNIKQDSLVNKNLG